MPLIPSKQIAGGGGGGTPTGRWDWPDEVSPAAASDWTDANSYGAAVSLAALEDGAAGTYVRMEPGAAGSNPYGALFAVGSGDWTYGFRVGRVTVDGNATVALNTSSMDVRVGGVFVDGTDLTTDPVHGAGVYMAGSDWDGAGSGLASFYGATWGAVGAVATQNYLGTTAVDVFLKRAGTTLEAFIAPVGQTPIKAGSWTVTTGAGLAGIYLYHGDVNHKHIARVDAYGALAGVPGVD